jgi:hypothetical protein
MAALITLVAICLSAAGVGIAILGVAVLAIRREERNLTLTGAAPDALSRAGRRLTGLYVRSPHRTAAGDRDKALT